MESQRKSMGLALTPEALSLWFAPDGKQRRTKKLDLADQVCATVSALARLIFHPLGALGANFR
jgi:hypothetical protein